LLLPRNANEKETKRLLIWKGYRRRNIIITSNLPHPSLEATPHTPNTPGIPEIGEVFWR
jgi:hypothetical protein